MISAVLMRNGRRFVVGLALCLTAWSCGDDGEGSRRSGISAIPGTSVTFDFSADLSIAEQFFDTPYPSDLRLDDTGHPELGGYPVPPGNRSMLTVKAIADDRIGFPVTAFAYFRFDAPLQPQDIRRWIGPSAESTVLLIDIDPRSAERGRLFPVVADTPPTDPYIPENFLAVAAVPGLVLAPNRQYAFAVRRSLADLTGAPLGVPLVMAQLLGGEIPMTPEGRNASELYASLRETLVKLEIDWREVAAATVFTTGDEVAVLGDLVERVADKFDVEIRDLALDTQDGTAHERFCELHGVVLMPQFQGGVPRFDTDGLFRYDSNQLPIVQREEQVAVALTIPRGAMPVDGYPLLMYFHGTGGPSTQVVDRGRVSVPGGEPEAGKGPAHVVAEHGIAAFGAALPLNQERYPEGNGRTYLNLDNLGAYPDTFRQGTIEQILLIEALDRLEIDPSVLAECTGISLPAGVDRYRVRTDRMFVMGQSLGGQFTNMVGALAPNVVAAVPTGSGGYWSLTVLDAEIVPGIPSAPLIATLLQTFELPTHLHPGLQLVQTAFEAAEPVAFAARLARDPLAGHPSRSIYQPVGFNDPGFPPSIYDAMALASGTQQAGEVIWPEMQVSLSLNNLAELVDYPVEDNALSTAGRAYTGVVVQYRPDGIRDGHHIFAQLDEVKFQYGCFFASVETGRPTVLAPGTLGSTCQ